MAGRSRASSSRAGTATRHNAPVQSAEELIPGFRAETELERRVTQDPGLLRGLAWGKPRKGHPEGTIANHVQDLLERLAREGVSGEERELLRFLVLVHDSFKNEVQGGRPRAGENHHAMRARRFAERYTSDERLLTTLELHDRPYGIWRKWRRTGWLRRKGPRGNVRRGPAPPAGSTASGSRTCSGGSPTTTCSSASWSWTARPRVSAPSRSSGSGRSC